MNHDPPATDVFSMPHQAPSGGFSDSDGWITVTDQPVPRIKGYELHEAIGRGGMGIVYRATHLESTKPVALKLMINSPVGLAMRARRFQTEGAIERLLDHPNIVQVVDVGQWRDDRNPWLHGAGTNVGQRRWVFSRCGYLRSRMLALRNADWPATMPSENGRRSITNGRG